MSFGQQFVYSTAHAATAFYFWALIAPACSSCRRTRWTIGWLFLLVHLAAAFHFAHHWSHTHAADATTRRTAELTGLDFAYGIYFNYAFALVWTLDVAWLWLARASYERRPRPITWLIHGFLAFIVFNATVVFGHGWVRWLSLGAFGAVAMRRRVGPRGDPIAPRSRRASGA